MRIAVYLASSMPAESEYGEKTAEFGRWIGSHGHTLVYGGSDLGLMGILADAVLSQGGTVIGVMPKFMVDRHRDHEGLTEFVITEDMASRRRKMMELADIYIALPGGPGTLEEISEVISSLRLDLIGGTAVLYNIRGYYDDLKKPFEKMEQEGFVTQRERRTIRFADTPEELVMILEEADEL